MFLPGTSAFARLGGTLAIPARTFEFRAVLAVLPRTIEFRTLAKRAIALGAITLGAIFARTRKPRTFVAAAILTRLVKTRPIKIACAVAGRTGIASGMIGRRSIALLPGLGFAPVGAAIRPVAEILARPPVGPAAEILARAPIRRAARKLLVAAEFSRRPITVPRRPRTIRAVSPRPIAVLAETLATRGVGPLFAAAFPWRVRFLVAEFPVLEARGRPRVASGGVGALFAAAILAARRAVVTAEVRAIAARGIGALFAATVLASGTVVALAGVRLAGPRIGLLDVGSGALGFGGIGPLLALALGRKILAGALGELLLGPPRGAGTALAAARPVTPAAGIVVLVGIAGHE